MELSAVTAPAVDAEQRLREAYQRYDEVFEPGSRPGSPQALRLAEARLDLAMALMAAGVALPELVTSQMRLDAAAVIAVTEPLPTPRVAS